MCLITVVPMLLLLFITACEGWNGSFLKDLLDELD